MYKHSRYIRAVILKLGHIWKTPRWISLVVWWLRIHLPVQGMWVWSWIWEDLTCHGATEPMYRNSWACALQLGSHSYWSPHTLEPVLPTRRSHCNEKPLHRCRRVAHAAVTIQHSQNTNQPDLLQLLMSGCQSLATDLLVWNGIRQYFLEAPRIFLVGSQGCEPLTEGLESLPFIKSALRGFDILFCFISLPRLIGNGMVWWGRMQMDTELFPAEHAQREGWRRMATEGSTRGLVEQTLSWTTVVRIAVVCGPPVCLLLRDVCLGVYFWERERKESAD